MLKKLVSDPLFHFVIVSALLYWVIDLASPEVTNLDLDTVKISNQDLLIFMQNRDQVFNDGLYKQKFAALNESERQLLIDSYVEQEVLVREAQKLGLDKNDETTRRRLTQKLLFFLEGLASAKTPLSTKELQQYFETNKEDYRQPELITFNHVFFKHKPLQEDDALIRVENALATLSESPDETEVSSDNFIYDHQYINKSQTQIAQHFGSEFAQALFDLDFVDEENARWQGPFASAYGQHIVWVSEITASTIPPFDEISQQITEDAQRIWKAEIRDRQIAELVEKYTVEAQ